MGSFSWKKTTGWAGVAFVIVFLASELPLADSPGLDDSGAAIRQWFEANETQLALTMWGVGLAIAFMFLLFASGLRSLLRPADARNEGMWSRVSFASAIALVALAGAKNAFWSVLAQDRILAAASDETVRTLAAFEAVTLTTIIPWSVAVFLVGASVVILQSGVMARWIGWLGMLSALLFVVGASWPITGETETSLGAVSIIGFIGWLVWTLGVSISMIRPERPDVP